MFSLFGNLITVGKNGHTKLDAADIEAIVAPFKSLEAKFDSYHDQLVGLVESVNEVRLEQAYQRGRQVAGSKR